MTDLLFDIPETTPEWQLAKDRHEIQTRQIFEDGQPHSFTAWIPGKPCASVEDKTERGAVVSLIHRLKLDGWQRISMNP